MSEFSRPFKITALADTVLSVDIEAGSSECKELARRFDIADVTSFKAHAEISGRTNDVIVRGTLKAQVVQNCVVTLEPLTEHYEESFVRRFVPATRLPKTAPGEEVFIPLLPDEEDLPDALEGDELDLGEIVAEELALVLNPYPRRQGATFELPQGLEGVELGEVVKPNPFAVLSKLKEKG